MPLSELLTWEPEDIATAMEWIDAENDAIKHANKGG
jgi:hypothetical protein